MSAAPDTAFRPINRLLKMAVVGGVEAAVRLHIERGDDVNARDDRGLTPLMLAASKNRAHICRVLIEAGADPLAMDRAGNDARSIALAAGANDAASEIEAALAAFRKRVPPNSSFDEPVPAPSEELTSDDVGTETRPPSNVDELSPGSATPTTTRTHVEAPGFGKPIGPVTGLAAGAVASPSPGSAFVIDDEPGPIDISCWEGESEQPPPEGDESLAAIPTSIHRTLSQHHTVDDSTDWSDFEAFLPDHAAPLPRSDSAEVAAELRSLLLRALREGSVPSIAVDDLDGILGDSTRDPPPTPLRYVIGDLGAETDERFEYHAAHETFEVYVAPAETADEELALDDALSFLSDLESGRNDPMRLYMREAQRRGLINAEEEVALAKEMESAVARALDALAGWPAGIQQALAAVEDARSGVRALNSITSAGREDAEPDHAVLTSDMEADSSIAVAVDEKHDTDEPGAEEGLGATSEDAAGEEPLAAGFLEAGERLRALAAIDDTSSLPRVRAALESLSLKRTFLMELAAAVVIAPSPEARRFEVAIRTLMAARDKMAGANLRLALSLAKRFLYSGLPMDDLIQEANIGLLKAVDKFDWRRGYKFSTMATWWIRQQVSRSVADESRTIRLPVHVHERLYRVERAAEAMSRQSGRTPSAATLAACLDMDERRVDALLRLGATPLSIDELDDEGNGRFDAIEDESADPFEAVAAKELRQALVSMLSRLDNRLAQVAGMRFGLDEVAAEPRTLEEVGLHFGVTRERIRQIEVQALRRLAHRNNRLALRGWVADEPAKQTAEEGIPTLDDGRAEEPPSARAISPAGTPVQRGIGSIARPSDDRAEGKGPSALDRLLALATEMGITVEDDRRGASGSTWVNLVDARNVADRRLIRKLLAAGFEFWPGKGYWK